MSLPKVAVVGASGYVGQFITEKGFLPALDGGKFGEVRTLTTKRSEAIEKLEKQGATIFEVDFSKVDTLVNALSGVDAVVSCMGTKEDGSVEKSKEALLEAIQKAGVKVYFPSEFGTNHYTRVKTYTHPVFEHKKTHLNAAKDRGIKTIAILCSDIMESTFGKWFGFNNATEVWTLVGTGNVPVAVTAERDVAKFTVEAVLKAYSDPNNIPEFIEFYSDMKTLKEYAQAFDKVAGRATKLEFTPIDEALAHYESAGKPFESLLQILFEEGAYDYTTSKGNELLNPGEKIWKLKKITEYAEETGGRPWKDFK